MAERRRLTVMAVATSALLVALPVCLLLITGGLTTDDWPVLGDDSGSALRLPAARASVGGTGSNGVVPAPGGTLADTVPGMAPAFPAPQPVRATLPDPSGGRQSQVDRDRGRGRSREQRRAWREGSKFRTVARTMPKPASRIRVRQSGGRERARAGDDRRSQRSASRTERRDNRVERRSHRAEGPAGRREHRTSRAEQRSPRSAESGRPAGRAKLAEQRAGRRHGRAERRDDRIEHRQRKRGGRGPR